MSVPTDDSGRRRAEAGRDVTERRLPVAEDFPATGPYSLAAPGPRFSARAIDLAVVAVPVVAAAVVWMVVGDRTLPFDEPWWLAPMALVLGVVYEFVSVAWKEKTLGKWAMGLRIVRYADGQGPDPGQSLLRALVPWAVLVVPWLGIFVLGALVVAVYATGVAGSLHRGLPDQAAGTIVISTR